MSARSYMNVTQGDLPLSIRKEEIADEFILKCKDLPGAIRLCIEVSCIPKKSIAFQLDISENHLSRILSENPDDNRHFPPEKLNHLMDVCQNEIPLRWQALTRGYGLYRLRTATEAELDRLRQEKEELQKQLTYFEELIKKVRL